MARDPKTSYRRAFWGAVFVTVVLWLIPFGGLAIYPFSMLATWAHEMGHGLTALIFGGQFHQLSLHANLSGVALTSSTSAAAGAAVSLGGLIGAPLLGALIIAVGPRERFSRVILIALGVAIVGSMAIWVNALFGTLACLGIAGLLGYAAWALSARRRFMLVQLLGIQLGLSALRSWEYLFMAEAKIGGKILASDVSKIADALGGHYLLWGILVLVVNLGLLYGGYRLARRRLVREGAAAGEKPPRRKRA